MTVRREAPPRTDHILLLVCLISAVTACSSQVRAAHCRGVPDLDIWEADLTGNVSRLVAEEGADGFADWSPDGERIAFVASRDGNCEIYIMNADGSDQSNLTNSRTDEMYPSWSPDGSEMVYAVDGQLEVLDLSSGDQTRLTQSDLIHAYPDWSPDGDWIAFSGGEEVPGPGAIHQIYVVPTSGGPERALTHGNSLLVEPRWSPDGGRIAYFDHADPLRIWEMGADGSNPRVRTDGGHQSWSPDGSTLVHDREVEPGDVDIFVDGELLVDGPSLDTLPTWSPDGSTILFSSDRP